MLFERITYDAIMKYSDYQRFKTETKDVNIARRRFRESLLP